MYVTFFIAIPQFLDDFLGGAVFPLFPLLLEVSIEIFSSSDSFFIFVWSAYKAIIGILHLYRGVIDLAFFFSWYFYVCLHCVSGRSYMIPTLCMRHHMAF